MNHDDFIKAWKGGYAINGITLERMEYVSEDFQVWQDKKIVRKYMKLEDALNLCVKLFKGAKK